MGVPTQDEST